MISSKRSLLVFAAIAAISSSSYATTLVDGGGVIASAVAPVSAGSPIDSNLLPFAATDGVFSGVETTNVFSGDTNNGLGGLTFTYNVSNDLTSIDSFDRVSLSGFAGFNTDVGFISPGGASLPVVITRSPDGDTIGFDFSSFNFPNDDVAPGAVTATLVIRTDAPFDTPNILSVIDGGTGSVASFGPAPSGGGGTPEPASLGIIGLGGLALLRRRRGV